MIRDAIGFALSNFTLTFLVIGLIFAGVAIARQKQPAKLPVIVDKVLAWHIFWVIGIGYLYNFVFHTFFGAMAAAFIGWADSPFQLEVGTASLGFAVVGFLAAFRSFDLRLASILGPTFFMWGAAAGHVYQMVTQHNFAPGNAGVIFWMDILIPVFGLVLLWLQYHHAGPASGGQRAIAGRKEPPHSGQEFEGGHGA